jgi:hypothetical protein
MIPDVATSCVDEFVDDALLSGGPIHLVGIIFFSKNPTFCTFSQHRQCGCAYTFAKSNDVV